MHPHMPKPDAGDTGPLEGCSADGENGFPIAPPTMPVEASLVRYNAACRALTPGAGGQTMSEAEQIAPQPRQRRPRGALTDETRHRISQLSEEQLHEVGARLQRLKPKIARAWTAPRTSKS